VVETGAGRRRLGSGHYLVASALFSGMDGMGGDYSYDNAGGYDNGGGDYDTGGGGGDYDTGGGFDSGGGYDGGGGGGGLF